MVVTKNRLPSIITHKQRFSICKSITIRKKSRECARRNYKIRYEKEICNDMYQIHKRPEISAAGRIKDMVLMRAKKRIFDARFVSLTFTFD